VAAATVKSFMVQVEGFLSLSLSFAARVQNKKEPSAEEIFTG
jgi:hypothetical protein